jgi:hypothetical protein
MIPFKIFIYLIEWYFIINKETFFIHLNFRLKLFIYLQYYFDLVIKCISIYVYINEFIFIIIYYYIVIIINVKYFLIIIILFSILI